MNLKTRIKQLCKERGISMNSLEQELGFGKGYISKLDKSKPNISKIKKIADYFNVTSDYLIGSENENMKADMLLEIYDSNLATDKQFKRIMEYYKKMVQTDRDMLENMAKRCAETKDD